MPSAPGGPPGERLAQRRVRFRVDLDAVPAAQPLQGHLWWASPRHHRTTCPVSGFCSRRRVGSSATSRARPCDGLSSSALPWARTASGSSRVRRRPGLDQDRVAGRGERVAGLRLAEPGHARQIARDAPVQRVLPAAERRGQRPDAEFRLVTGARGVPVASRPWPHRCTESSGRRVPEKTRTSETRPTYGSEDVFTTSATSGPSGSQTGAGRGLPEGGDGGRGALQRGREAAGDQLQQFDRADALAGALGGRGRREDEGGRSPGRRPAPDRRSGSRRRCPRRRGSGPSGTRPRSRR